MGHRLPWNAWVKELRAELGAKQKPPRAKISQEQLAAMLGGGLSMVGKWEMKDDPQEPGRDTLLKLLSLASPQLRARAPQVVDLPEVSDPDRTVNPADNTEGFIVTSKEAMVIGERLEAILPGLDKDERYKLMMKCLGEIDAAAEHRTPSKLGAG